MEGADVDTNARVQLCHAAVQAIADDTEVDLLHIKGPAIDPQIQRSTRLSTDADVLIRPQQTSVFVDTLRTHGWRLVTDFHSGSFFEHAANFHHDSWGYVDLHRAFPGVTIEGDDAFERLWSKRASTEIAHWPCPVPAVVDQAVLLTLHAARGEGSIRAQRDVDAAFHSQPDVFQEEVRQRAATLGADLALAAALGELDRFQDDPRHDLWLFYSTGGSRMDEWRGRWRATRSLRGKARVLMSALGVNREYVAMEIGHDPSPAELRAAYRRRIANAWGSLRSSRQA